MKFSSFFAEYVSSLPTDIPHIDFALLKKALLKAIEDNNFESFVEKLLESISSTDLAYAQMVDSLPNEVNSALKNATELEVRNEIAIDLSATSEIKASTSDKIHSLLLPMGDLYKSLAKQTLFLGNYAYMNFTAARKLIKRFSKQGPPQNCVSIVKSHFEGSHIYQDQSQVKALLASMLPGLALESGHKMLAACRNGDMELVRKLILLEGADVNFSSPSDGKTALHVAAAQSYTKLVEMLIDLKGNVSALCYMGMSPLASALVEDSTGSIDAARLLFNAGADVTLPANLDRLRDLCYKALDAAGKNNVQKLRKLWAAGVSMRDESTTVLHMACASGSLKSLNFIIDKGIIDIRSKDQQGRLAIEVIPQNSDDEIVKLLVTAMANTTSPLQEDRLKYLLNIAPRSMTQNLDEIQSKDSAMILGRRRSDLELGDMPPVKEKDPQPEKNLFLSFINQKMRALYLLVVELSYPWWLKDYKWKSYLKDDIISGVALAGLYIPSSMALAQVVGIPPEYGIYSALFSASVYAWFCTSNHLCVGPLSIVSLLVSDALNSLPETNQTQRIQRAVLFALQVGIIFLALGLLRLGFLVKFLSGPALKGFTTAAALLTAVSQLSNLLGSKLSGKSTLYLHQILIRNIKALPSSRWQTVLFSAVSIFAVFQMREKLPGKLAMLSSFIIMIISLILSAIFNFSSNGFYTVGEVKQGIPSLVSPLHVFRDFMSLLPSAAFIALVGFIETVASAKKWAKTFGYKIDIDRELVVIGCANLSMPLTGGMPIFGSLSNSAANAELGGKTPMTTLVRSITLLLIVLFLTKLFAPLPKCTLAVVVVMSVIKLVDFSQVPKLLEASKSDLGVWLSACVLTLFCGVNVGMATAAALSLCVFLARTSKPRVIVLAREIGTLHYIPVYTEKKSSPLYFFDQTLEENKNIDKTQSLVLSFQAPLWYANAELLKEKVLELFQTEQIHTVVIDMSAVSFIDTTAVELLRDLTEELKPGQNVIMCQVNERVEAILRKEALFAAFAGIAIDETRFAENIYEAIRRGNILSANHKRMIAKN
jgi:sulfate permease, SulP family